MKTDDSRGAGAPNGIEEARRRARVSPPRGKRFSPELRIQGVEITDPPLEGTAERIGFETTDLLGRRRACNVRVVVAKATYKTTARACRGRLPHAASAPSCTRRSILRPRPLSSFIAYPLTNKYRWGMPFHRVAVELLAEEISLDDSTMCRYAEHVGATFGCIVDAMWNW